jgi:hypothetical protein
VPRSDTRTTLVWDTGRLELRFGWSASSPVVLDSWDVPGSLEGVGVGSGGATGGDAAVRGGASGAPHWGATQPLVEVLVQGSGAPGTTPA